jgi:hypothetical protein
MIKKVEFRGTLQQVYATIVSMVQNDIPFITHARAQSDSGIVGKGVSLYRGAMANGGFGSLPARQKVDAVRHHKGTRHRSGHFTVEGAGHDFSY